MSAAHGHVVVDRSMSSGTATSHAQDTLLPWRTARAAASWTSSVMWFRVPSSSSSPHRPQFDSVLKYPSTSSCVGIGPPCRHPSIDSSGHAVRGTAGRVSRRWIEDRNDLVDQTTRPHRRPLPKSDGPARLS
jgi:hypothetical protein